MSRLHWMMRRAERRLGKWGLIAILLFIASVIFLFTNVLPMQASNSNLKQQLAVLPVKPKTITPVLSSEQSLIKELASFQNKFSTVEHLPDQLYTLFRLTKAHQLVIDKAEYSLSEKSKTAIQRFEVILPVTGTYPQVKGLILEVLEKLPTVGLGDIVLEREQVGENRAKATLHLVFFVRKQA